MSAPTRYVIFHRPGPTWNRQLGALEQPGVARHFEYLQAAFRAGKIQLAGPFPEGDTGGMIIMSAAATERDAAALVESDPGVKSGLIRAEVGAWLTTLG
jgi:uncharacterized protein YciI